LSAPAIPPDALVLLVGPAGSGKSTWAVRRFTMTEVVSSDAFRMLVADDATDQDATADAFRILHAVVHARLRRGLRCVIDATNVSRRARRGLLSLAARADRPVVAVVFDVPLAVCLARNEGRVERRVPADVVRRQHREMALLRDQLPAEGYASMVVVGEDGGFRTPAAGTLGPVGLGQMPDRSADAPYVRFSQHTLANGLRVIVAPDRVAPVVAINLWYDVGSKHELPGKTGFAHLFEHFMFQGSRHVAKTEHLGIVQAAGGVCNATTYFDRTNYFETLPSHQVELGLWLEADRMATLLDALSQNNLDNQRDVVKNEKRQSYDNRPYGSFYEKLMAAVFPAGHPYHHTPIGSMEDLDAASLEDVRSFFQTWYVPNNAVLTVAGDLDEQPVIEMVERYFGPIAGNPALPDFRLRDPGTATASREIVPDEVPLVRIHVGYRCPAYGTREFDALEVATQILAGGRGSRLHRRLVREEQVAQDVTLFALPLVAGSSIAAGWVTLRPGAEATTVEAILDEELSRMSQEPVSDDELVRAGALIESSEMAALSRMDEVADRLSMYATYFDRPELINEQLARYLAVDAEAVRSVCTAVFDTSDRAQLTYVPRVDEQAAAA
jgi:predicted Zn-dependent peptidase/predicted kinase